MTERKKTRLPKFASYKIAEEAAFWDSHSLEEFENQLKEVKLKVARPLEHHLSVRLDAQVITELTKIAADRGIGPSTLARMWLMERLAQERERGRQAAEPTRPGTPQTSS